MVLAFSGPRETKAMRTLLANSTLMLSSISFLKAHFQISKKMYVNVDRLLWNGLKRRKGHHKLIIHTNVYSAFQDRASDRSSGKPMLKEQVRIMILRDFARWHVLVRSFPFNTANWYTRRMFYPN